MKKIISSNFLSNIINNNIKFLNYRCNTRFSPEGNGFIHIGHLKNIIINNDISRIYNGEFKIRIDDTNPEKNEKIFIKYIFKNTKWLIKNLKKSNKKKYYASNYFHKFYQYLEFYKKKNKNNKFKIIRKIKSGYYREKNKNIVLKKNKIIYKIKIYKHIKTSNNWYIYPLYDWAHVFSDKIENINYSICSIEFCKNKKFYNYIKFIIYKKILPKQIECSRLIIKNKTTSKKKINFLIKNKYIKNHKNSILTTLNGLKSSGFNKNIIYCFIKKLGLSRKLSLIEDIFLNKTFLNILKNTNIKNINNFLENFIKIKINYNNLLKFKTKSFSYFLTNILLINKEIFIKSVLKNKYYLKNLKKFIKLNYLKTIICYKYLKNNLGKIILIYCKFIKLKNKYNKNINWINFKYKNIFIVEKKNNLINFFEKKYKINEKFSKKYYLYTGILKCNNIEKKFICNNNYFILKKNKNFNKINFNLTI